jgi:hypothetical protein
MSFVQTKDKTYMTHGYSNDDDGYNICEIVVHPDYSYTFKTYKVAKRKDRKNYKSAIPIISFGKIKRDGSYYIHTEYKKGKPTDHYLVSKLSDKKIILYKEHDDGYLERLEVYKRIE